VPRWAQASPSSFIHPFWLGFSNRLVLAFLVSMCGVAAVRRCSSRITQRVCESLVEKCLALPLDYISSTRPITHCQRHIEMFADLLPKKSGPHLMSRRLRSVSTSIDFLIPNLYPAVCHAAVGWSVRLRPVVLIAAESIGRLSRSSTISVLCCLDSWARCSNPKLSVA